MREQLINARRIVVKVGTSTLTYGTGKLNYQRIEKLARTLADLANQGKQIVLVTSGAVAAGMERAGLDTKPSSIPRKQALAAVGQGILMHVYEKLFGEYGQTVAQVLLTRENSIRHNQYINSRNALLTLLEMEIIPIVNENDAISVDELKIGDNDTLSAIVATLIDADALIILSDIKGLYTANPQNDPTAELIEEIREITPEVEHLAGGAGSTLGTGGMFTKIQAAKIAVSSGVAMVIASGDNPEIIRDVLAGKPEGTIFYAKESHLKLKKSWLAFGKCIQGDIVVDQGCAKAMVNDGSSLLAAGVVNVYGDFTAGNTVRVLDDTGREIARGIVNYDAATITRIRGKNSQTIGVLLRSDSNKNEVIHRDNMVLMA